MGKKSKTRSEKFQVPSPARIKVVGVGGGGGNVVSRMSTSSFKGVEFIAINTDVQDLNSIVAKKKIHIGKNLTRGLGAGMNPELGRQAAEENLDEITAALEGADMIFVTAGLGGGTGSGASSVIADAARKTGALTIGVVTKPFFFEGSQRMKIAEDALLRLREKVDAAITIPNDRIFAIIDKDTPLLKAFERIDDILRQAVQGISELVTAPGVINVDFADVKAIMQDAGTAIVGTGIGSGEDRAVAAAKTAITSPLLEIGVDGARGILFSVAGSRDMRMNEINDAAKLIADMADPASKIIFGAYHDRRLKPGTMKSTVIAAGFDGHDTAKSNQSLGLFGNPVRVEVSGGFLNGDKGARMVVPSSPAPLGSAFGGSSTAKGANNGSHDADVKKKYAEELSDDDAKWEIPAFLRRKKNKR